METKNLKTFNIEYVARVYTTLEIKAETAEQAEEIAWKQIDKSNLGDYAFCDDDGELRVMDENFNEI